MNSSLPTLTVYLGEQHDYFTVTHPDGSAVKSINRNTPYQAHIYNALYSHQYQARLARYLQTTHLTQGKPQTSHLDTLEALVARINSAFLWASLEIGVSIKRLVLLHQNENAGLIPELTKQVNLEPILKHLATQLGIDEVMCCDALDLIAPKTSNNILLLQNSSHTRLRFTQLAPGGESDESIYHDLSQSIMSLLQGFLTQHPNMSKLGEKEMCSLTTELLEGDAETIKLLFTEATTTVELHLDRTILYQEFQDFLINHYLDKPIDDNRWLHTILQTLILRTFSKEAALKVFLLIDTKNAQPLCTIWSQAIKRLLSKKWGKDSWDGMFNYLDITEHAVIFQQEKNPESDFETFFTEWFDKYFAEIEPELRTPEQLMAQANRIDGAIWEPKRALDISAYSISASFSNKSPSMDSSAQPLVEADKPLSTAAIVRLPVKSTNKNIILSLLFDAKDGSPTKEITFELPWSPTVAPAYLNMTISATGLNCTYTLYFWEDGKKYGYKTDLTAENGVSETLQWKTSASVANKPLFNEIVECINNIVKTRINESPPSPAFVKPAPYPETIISFKPFTAKETNLDDQMVSND